jgi:hypothetical protein
LPFLIKNKLNKIARKYKTEKSSGYFEYLLS